MNLFEFDYDLTMMVFFMDGNEKVYARYGGRDPSGADARQSLKGLRYTMQSVLETHRSEQRSHAPKSGTSPRWLRQETGVGGGRCLHCHQVKEALNRKLVSEGLWSRDRLWRYPLPENVGVRLEVDRGNVVENVLTNTPAARSGLKPGDILRSVGTVPVHSFGDAQYALDLAPAQGTLPISWSRGRERHQAVLTLEQGWRKTDVSWRPSMRRLVPSLPLYGEDLTAEERKALKLTPTQLAFRQNNRLQTRAKEAGFQVGDVVLGLEGRPLDLDVIEFLRFVRSEYLAGDTITLEILRGDKRLKIPLTLANR